MIYFISDIHLGLYERSKDRERENLLLAFLDKIKHDCRSLIIVGDLFDYWFEYKYVVPKYFYRTLAKLHELRDSGIEIDYLMGNHDFGHLDFFKNELNIDIHFGDIEREFGSKRFYISHGDGKALNDTGYRILKNILRAKWANKLYRYIHPDLGIRIAAGSSQKSRNYTGKKYYGEQDGMELFAEKKIAEGFDYVIMGHRHKLLNKRIGTGYYINLGDWLVNPHYGRFDGENFELLSVNKLISDTE
jgi:UDP-2,3-diacylglucosamine hydrolase